MLREPVDFFHEQYREGELRYQKRRGRIQKLFAPLRCDRYMVASKLVVQLCSYPGDRRILDFGCGDGHVVRLIADSVADGVAEIFGIDLSSERIRRAEQLGATRTVVRPRIRFLVGDERKIDEVEEHGFDLVLCIAVLSQVYDIYGLVERLRTSLIPGGRLIAEFQNYAYLRRRFQLLLGDVPTVSPVPMSEWPTIGWDTGHLHHFSLSSSLRFFEQAQFDVESVHSTGLLANLLPVRSPLLATGFVIVGRRGA